MGFVTLRRRAVELGIHSLGKLVQFCRMKLNAWCCCVWRAISVRGNVRRITAVRGVFAISNDGVDTFCVRRVWRLPNGKRAVHGLMFQ